MSDQPDRWTPPAPATLPRRTLRKALDVLGIDPGTFTALILTGEGTARIELTHESGERDVIHVPLTDDTTPESVPMVPLLHANLPTEAFTAPAAAPFDSMFDPDEWTTRHTYRPEPSETSPAPGWVRRAAPPATPHKCQPPMRVVTALPPPPFPGDGPPPAHTVRTIPDGNPGDVWRCECSRLWRRWYRIDGILTLAVWDPAPWWLRFRYRRTPGSAS